jgi:hypothetical protein
MDYGIGGKRSHDICCSTPLSPTVVSYVLIPSTTDDDNRRMPQMHLRRYARLSNGPQCRSSVEHMCSLSLEAEDPPAIVSKIGSTDFNTLQDITLRTEKRYHCQSATLRRALMKVSQYYRDTPGIKYAHFDSFTYRVTDCFEVTSSLYDPGVTSSSIVGQARQ